MSSTIAQNLIQGLSQSAPAGSAEKIKVNTVASAASFVYEKIRNAVDLNEDHLVKKNAIFRILKRKLVLEKVLLENYLLDKYHSDNIAQQLL